MTKTHLSKPMKPILLPGPAYHLAFGEEQLYWVQTTRPSEPNELVKLDLKSGTQQVLMRGEVGRFAADRSDVFALSGESVIRVSIASGEQAVLATGQHATADIAVDATFVYWTNSDTRRRTEGAGSAGRVGSISRVARSGGSVEVLAEIDTSNPRIALSANEIYWTGEGINAVAKSGGAVRAIVDAIPTNMPGGFHDPSSVAADQRFVYFAAGGGAYRVERGANAAGGVERVYEAGIVLQVLPSSAGLIIARNTVFVMREQVEKGALVLLEEGGPKVLIETARPSSVALSSGAVYFIETPIGGGTASTIRSVTLP